MSNNSPLHMTAGEADYVESNRIALIDADYIKYLVTYDMSKLINDEGVEPNVDILIGLIQERVSHILPFVKCKAKVFLWSCKTKNNFRTALAREKPYKGARKSKELPYPEYFKDQEFVRSYIEGQYYSLSFDDLEADDLLGMLQSEDTFIYSKDKDARTVPGMHYDIKTDEFIFVTEEQAWRNLMMQMITGDSTDGIIGLRSVGPAGAKKMLDDKPHYLLLPTVFKAYIDKHGNALGLAKLCENHNLLNITPATGEYMEEKYKDAYKLIETLKQLPDVIK